jgi:hypothetical protein
LLHVGNKLNVGTVGATARHTEGIGAFGHHHPGGGSQQTCSESNGDSVVAGADGSDAARQFVGIQVQHNRQRTTRLERAGVLEKLQLEKDIRLCTDDRLELKPLPAPDRRLSHQIAEPLAIGSDRLDRWILHNPSLHSENTKF